MYLTLAHYLQHGGRLNANMTHMFGGKWNDRGKVICHSCLADKFNI